MKNIHIINCFIQIKWFLTAWMCVIFYLVSLYAYIFQPYFSAMWNIYLFKKFKFMIYTAINRKYERIHVHNTVKTFEKKIVCMNNNSTNFDA